MSIKSASRTATSTVSRRSATSKTSRLKSLQPQRTSASRSRDKVKLSGEANETGANPEMLSALTSSLRVGSRGNDVKALQGELNKKLGLDLKTDGIYGQATRNAVRQLQEKNKLGVDGVFGKDSRAALLGNQPVSKSEAALGNQPVPKTEAVGANAETKDDWAERLPERLRPYAGAYQAAGERHNVDPRFLAAISMQETGNGGSSAFRNKNNAMGISGKGRPKRFSSVESSIDTMASTLAKRDGYYAGKNTISSIANTYAPLGAANDPRGLNAHWHKNVSRNFRNLGGDPSQPVVDRGV